MADSALRILESEYAQKRIRAELEKDRRREEVFARIPELQALDMRKRRLIVSRFRAKRAGEEAEDISSQVQAIEARMREMLKGNGYSADYLENVYECPQCGDTGVLPQNFAAQAVHSVFLRFGCPVLRHDRLRRMDLEYSELPLK